MTDIDRHWRYVIAVSLILGYIGLAVISFYVPVPKDNTRFVDGFFTGLGPIVGAAVTAVMNVGRGNGAQQDQNLSDVIGKLPGQPRSLDPNLRANSRQP